MARAAIAYLGRGDEIPAGDFHVVGEVRADRGPARRPLTRALERIAAGDARVLVTSRLERVARSLRELIALLDWLEAASADLVVIDVELDTGSAPGRHVARVLREIERLERHPPPGHPRRGRPPLHQRAPDLARRIERLRDSGLSLQAIADALNADGAPTPRGGAEWRPSSVQAALGYRRPRPPAPGAPPPPPRPRPPAPGAPPPPPPRPPHRRR